MSDTARAHICEKWLKLQSHMHLGLPSHKRPSNVADEFPMLRGLGTRGLVAHGKETDSDMFPCFHSVAAPRQKEPLLASHCQMRCMVHGGRSVAHISIDCLPRGSP